MVHAHSPVLNIMIKAVEKAGRALIRDFGEVEHLQVSKKGPADFVSAADKKAEKILREELEISRPGYSFIMEESGEIVGEDKDHTWIIDPLDGTNNFICGIPHWCISLALKEKDEIVAAVILDPAKDEMFIAEKGKGAFSNTCRLRVKEKRNLMDAMVAASGVNIGEYINTNKQFNIRSMGCAALNLAYVAAGRFDAVIGNNLKVWDIAAGFLLIKESGGFVADTNGNKISFDKVSSVVAANPNLMKELVGQIAEKRKTSASNTQAE